MLHDNFRRPVGSVMEPLCQKNSEPQGKIRITRGALVMGVMVGSLMVPAYPLMAQEATTSESTQDNDEAMVALPMVTVRGERAAVTDSYSGGQIASGGRVGMLGDKGFMETPFNTIGYTEDYIQDAQARDITDVIAATDPSVFTSGVTGQNLESYSIRGFRSDVGDVTINGLFGMAPYYRSSPEMFERIEVLKGPSALLNGMPPKGSAGGAVNLVPKRAGDEPLANLTASYLSDSQLGGHIDLGRRFGADDQFGVRFNGAYRNGDAAVNQQDQRNGLVSLGLDWRGDRVRLSADLYDSQEHVNGPTRGVTLAPGVSVPRLPEPDTLLNPSWAFNDIEDRGAMIRGELDISDNLMAYAAAGMSTTSFKSTSASLTQVFNEAGDLRTNLGDVNDEVDRKTADIGLRSSFRTGPVHHELALNGTYYTEDYELNARGGVLPADIITNIYRPVWGDVSTVFNAPPITQRELELTSFGLADTLSFAQDRLHLTLGVRHQRVVQDSFFGPDSIPISSYDESALTPAAAVLFELTDQVSVYANYIEGLSQGASAPSTASNAGETFKPYKTKQKEVGLKFDLGEFAHTLSFYEITRPSSYTDPVTNVFSFGGEQRNRGVEWGFFGSPAEHVRLMGGVAYVDPELTKTAGGINQGKQATGIPKLQAKLGAEWDLPFVQGLTLTGNASAVSQQYLNEDNSLSLSGRTLYDLGARYNTKMSGYPVTWRLNIENLTNKAYWAKPHYTTLALGAPRTVMLSATVGF
ncbi:MAG: TonB-dependent receptor [Oceanisphaera sp.]